MSGPRPLHTLAMVLALTACSGRGDGAGNEVDVGAAASRAQADIANYAAMPAPRPTASPAPRPTPVRSATASPAPIADDAAPDAVVARYFDAIGARRYGEAWALWDEDGAASGMTQAAFAASFDPYASYRAKIGTPFDADAGAGQRYITVPVVITGTLRSGKPFRLEGPVMLHKGADGIESDDPHAHAWRIRNSELKSRPLS